MKIFVIKSQSPYETLAYENIIMNDEDIKDDVLIFYQHKNAIVIGNNQNAYEEINKEYVKEHDIKLARRMSGGGAVYHDLGNINFSFISDKSDNNSYIKFLTPIIAFLNSLGIQAEFHGRNDILANGFKISGNAQYIHKNRIVSHGTLLFNVDMSYLSKALNPNKIKFESKGIQSVRARVSNIIDLLKDKMSVDEFKEKLVKFFVEKYDAKLCEIPFEKYKTQLENLRNKFSSEEWIYDKNATFSYTNIEKFAGGLIIVKGNIEKGKIINICFEGDFLSKKDPREIFALFDNINYNEAAIMKVLNSIDYENYFGSITKEELCKLILG